MNSSFKPGRGPLNGAYKKTAEQTCSAVFYCLLISLFSQVHKYNMLNPALPDGILHCTIQNHKHVRLHIHFPATKKTKLLDRFPPSFPRPRNGERPRIPALEFFTPSSLLALPQHLRLPHLPNTERYKLYSTNPNLSRFLPTAHTIRTNY